ncbi:MAG TPA: ACP S-malonyltransferase [Candidatus Sumerlaeota bacterium]|nr:ACP S-malonyltransferase [Candidatus Sumerlaeota bacterium]
MKIAFVFPGQGSQAVGMGKDAHDRDRDAATLFSQADKLVGLPLQALCFEGPSESLSQTENTQPALAVSSAATLQILRKAGIKADAYAGHSLGEYSALYAAGSIDFDTLISLVKIRGDAFAQAAKTRPGAMAAILGLDAQKVSEVCTAASQSQYVAPANFNDPSQIVISGEKDAVQRACDAAKAAGAKLVSVLPVSGAFHSPLVAPASQVMKDALATAKIAPPSALFINNVDAKQLTDPDAIRSSLVSQVTGAVRWVESVQALVAAGVTTFVEVGSGKVLGKLIRRIHKDAIVHSTENNAAMDATIAALAPK